MNVLYPYLSWVTTFYSVFLVQYINQPFSDQIPAFPMYWPIFYFFFVPHFLIFFSSALPYSLPHFILFPVCSTSLSLSFPKFPFPSLSYPLLVFVYVPCLHSLCSCFCAWTKCSSDQLAPINRLETMIHDHLTILREPPFVMDDLFISALPRLFSLLVLRCLLFSPSKDGYAPKSVYPLRYVIVSTILLLLIWFCFYGFRLVGFFVSP